MKSRRWMVSSKWPPKVVNIPLQAKLLPWSLKIIWTSIRRLYHRNLLLMRSRRIRVMGRVQATRVRQVSASKWTRVPLNIWEWRTMQFLTVSATAKAHWAHTAPSRSTKSWRKTRMNLRMKTQTVALETALRHWAHLTWANWFKTRDDHLRVEAVTVLIINKLKETFSRARSGKRRLPRPPLATRSTTPITPTRWARGPRMEKVTVTMRMKKKIESQMMKRQARGSSISRKRSTLRRSASPYSMIKTGTAWLTRASATLKRITRAAGRPSFTTVSPCTSSVSTS